MIVKANGSWHRVTSVHNNQATTKCNLTVDANAAKKTAPPTTAKICITCGNGFNLNPFNARD